MKCLVREVVVSLMTNIIAEAHMDGQKNAGCLHPSWGNACGYVSLISGETLGEAAKQYVKYVSNLNVQPKKVDIKELIRCKKFLVRNGWLQDEESKNEEYATFYKDEHITIDVSDSEIVFISISGDFLHLDVNYFALVGALVEYRQVSFGYVSTIC